MCSASTSLSGGTAGFGRARRWFVVVLGVGLAGLGASLLLSQRVQETSWYVETGWDLPNEGRRVVEAALLMDTRGAPLRVEGTNVGRQIEGDAGPGFDLSVKAKASRLQPSIMRLVDPSGVVVWERSIPAGRSVGVRSSILDRDGVWRFEFVGRGRGAWVMAEGHLRGSCLSRGCATIPVGWMVIGVAAAISVHFGRRGARFASVAVFATGLTMPFVSAAVRESFGAFWPSLAAMVVAAVVPTVGGGFAAGWTWPHRAGPPPRVPDVVVGFIGVAVVLSAAGVRPGVLAMPQLPVMMLTELPVMMLTGLALSAVAAWRIGRRFGADGAGLRVALFALLGCALWSASLLLLATGGALAIVFGTGIGPSDNGPVLWASAAILVVTVPVTWALGWAGVRSFRASRPTTLPAPGR